MVKKKKKNLKTQITIPKFFPILFLSQAPSLSSVALPNLILPPQNPLLLMFLKFNPVYISVAAVPQIRFDLRLLLFTLTHKLNWPRYGESEIFSPLSCHICVRIWLKMAKYHL